MAGSKIEWTNKVWNPVRGCSRVSEGCRNCYAERQAIRQSKPGQAYHGLVLSHEITRAGQTRHEPRWTGKIALDYEKLEEPLHWRKPARIFVNSMSDLFHPDVPFDFVDQVMAIVAASGEHTFQILTKRPGRMRDYFRRLGVDSCEKVIQTLCANEDISDEFECRVANAIYGSLGEQFNVGWPMRNLWIGVSVEDQAAADKRIPLLLETPAAVRWISAEPLLGPIDLKKSVDIWSLELRKNGHWLPDPASNPEPVLHWAVVGGESGPGARPCNVEWIRSLVKQCQEVSLPVFVKQLGANPFLHRQSSIDQKIPGGSFKCSSFEMESTVEISDRKGGCIDDFPADLRIRQYPEAACAI